MKLTVKDLYDLKAGLNDILDKELPTSVAFSIQQNFKKVGDELKPSDEVRKKITEKYKEHITEDGRIPDDVKREAFRNETKELADQEVKIALKKFKLSDLGEEIKPRTLGLLSVILEEDKK
ncbi:hypothetical protein [Virgibacillus sp. YIM 98842]|uniref:hypothetical protein n=1 Tax=Virgibacillus sp. YIM 98842 TaxID=2663533 RepID=UPI0013D9F912|nr:hypothetical protein [Virgibacillus sp. YIM 98842]